MITCPNCGATIAPYKCKCEYCGTWYFDFTAFDMSKDEPYYVKFRTPYGVITTLARPELQSIEINNDTCDIVSRSGVRVNTLIRTISCDLNVVFHSQTDPEKNRLYTIEVNKDVYNN